MASKDRISSSVVAFVAIAGCHAPVAIEPERDREDGHERKVKIEFEAIVDPSARSFEIVSVAATSGHGLAPLPIDDDGVPGSGPADTIEVESVSTGFGAACGFESSFCVTVRVRSFYGVPLNNVYAHVTSIVPAAGHLPLNADPPQMGVDNRLGLWRYGQIGSNGSTDKLWAFQDDGSPWRMRAEILGDVSTGIAPELSVVPSPGRSVVWSGVLVGQSAEMTFEARNIGGSDLVIDPLTIVEDVWAIPSDGSFELVDPPSPVTVAPGASHTYRVRFTPPTGLAHQARVRVEANGAHAYVRLDGRATEFCTPMIFDTDEPANDSCETATDRGTYLIDGTPQTLATWSGIMYAGYESDWSTLRISFVGGCEVASFALWVALESPGDGMSTTGPTGGERDAIRFRTGPCDNLYYGAGGRLGGGFDAFGEEHCNRYNNDMPIKIRVSHEQGNLACLPYTASVIIRTAGTGPP